MVGQTLAHYEILDKLGQGGMGEVYLAQDTKLDRKIALKVLPPELAESEERRERFKREAKALAALNYPGIVQVYSVEESDGTQFITMELVEGKRLTELIPKGGMELDRFFDIAIPLADAVAVAHEKGVIHRDLKPDNVMVAQDGGVKVLDFGLARQGAPVQVDGGSDSPTAAKTQEGVIAGTLYYMSPEQAEGKRVDARSDVFSLGVVLYEMVSGNRPFDGDTPAAVVASILRDDPLPSLPSTTPALLGRLVRRCLTRELDRRYQTVRDVRNELEDLKGDPSSLTGDTLASEQTRTWPLRAIAVVAVIFGGLAAAWFASSRGSVPYKLANPTQITSALVVDEAPYPSPDGRLLAYQSLADGNWDIWVTQVAQVQPRNLTSDHTGVDLAPSWSPDGQRIAFLSDRDGGGVFVVPFLGGTPQKVASKQSPVRSGHAAPQWSPDGTRLAFHDFAGGDRWVEFVDLETGSTTRLVPDGLGTRLNPNDLCWSPDGRFLAYAPGGHGLQVSAVWVVDVVSDTAHRVTDERFHDHSPTWASDSRTIYFVSNRGGSRDLWRQALDADGKPVGQPQAVTAGVGLSHAAMSRDGSRLAYSKGGTVANVWRVPMFEDKLATWDDAQAVTADEAFVEFIDVSPEGSEVVFSSDRRGNMDLWVVSSEGGQLRQLTTDTLPDWGPRWSPDGKEIAYWSFRGGTRDIWAIPSAGGHARQVTKTEGQSWFASWSPDGREILYWLYDQGVWTVPSVGGSARQVAEIGARPDWSPDGEWISLQINDGEPSIIRPDGEGLTPLQTNGFDYARWSPDSTELYFNRENALWAYSVASRSERQVADLSDREGSAMWAPVSDGRNLYFTWRTYVGDIWVMDVVRE